MNDNIKREEKLDLFAGMLELPDLIKNYGEKIELAAMVMEATYRDDDIVIMIRPEVLVAEGQYDEAAMRLNEIIIARPENYYAWEKLLLVFLERRDYKNLEIMGKECATRFNRSFLAKLLYATGANENKNYDVAIGELKKAEILAGDNKELLLQVLSLRADIYYRQKDYEGAFKSYDEALTYNNEDLTILNNYAYFLAEQNMRLKEAEAMAAKVISKENKNTTFLDTYAWVLYKRGKLKAADKIMDSVINSGEKEDSEWFEHYGFIKKGRNDCRNAVIYWNKAFELDNSKIYLLKEIKDCHGSL